MKRIQIQNVQIKTKLNFFSVQLSFSSPTKWIPTHWESITGLLKNLRKMKIEWNSFELTGKRRSFCYILDCPACSAAVALCVSVRVCSSFWYSYSNTGSVTIIMCCVCNQLLFACNSIRAGAPVIIISNIINVKTHTRLNIVRQSG